MAVSDLSSDMSDLRLSKYCSALLSEDKKMRKIAIEDIDKEIIQDGAVVENKVDQVYKHILRCFNDKAEAVRLSAINLFTEIIKSSSDTFGKQYLVYLIPILTQRLGSPDMVESSEEVRLLLVHLLHKVIQKYKTDLPPYLDDLIKILVQTLVDPFPEMKIQSYECASDLAKAIPQHFHQQSESLIQPTLIGFNHQRYKVRVAAINAIGDIMRYGNGKAMDQVTGPMASRLFDQIVMVRQAVIAVASMWLLDLPDRYSFFHRLLPILLTGLYDDQPDTSRQAADSWDLVGKQFLRENEDELKDQLDFLSAQPAHYPANIHRPNLGCRTLVSRHMSKVLAALARELSDWLPDVRFKSAQLLGAIALNAEANVTHHLETLLAPMYRAALDEDRRVVDSIHDVAFYLGHFVPCDTYCDLILPTMERDLHTGHLRVLAGVLGGSDPHTLPQQLRRLGVFVSRPSVCRSVDQAYQLELLNCCDALLQVCQGECAAVSWEIFVVLVSVAGLAAGEAVGLRAKGLLERLSRLHEMDSVSALYRLHMRGMVEDVGQTAESWTVHSHDRLIFNFLLLHSGPGVGSCLDVAVPVLGVVATLEKEPEVRLKALTTVATLLVNHAVTFERVADTGPWVSTIVQDVITPNLVWHAGRTAEAVRTAAASCLCAALRLGAAAGAAGQLEGLLPPVLTLAEDASKRTRQYALRALAEMLKQMRSADRLTAERMHQVYPVVLARLDDTDGEVRVRAVTTTAAVFRCLPPGYSLPCFRGHWDAVFNALLIHLDDADPTFRAVVLDALKAIGQVNPKLLLEKVTATKMNFRNTSGCSELESFLESKVN